MNMPYYDFKKIEATYFFMLRMKSGEKDTNKKDEIKEKLKGLPTTTFEELGMNKDELGIF